jgi:hypothetical protein
MDTNVNSQIIGDPTVELPHVKHIIQGINKQNAFGQDGDVPTYVIEATLEKYYAQGYKLFHVEVIAFAMSGVTLGFFQMLYVLVRE